MTDLVNEWEGRKSKREEGREGEWKEERKNERNGTGVHMCMRESVSKDRGAWNVLQWFWLLIRIRQ